MEGPLSSRSLSTFSPGSLVRLLIPSSLGDDFQAPACQPPDSELFPPSGRRPECGARQQIHTRGGNRVQWGWGLSGQNAQGLLWREWRGAAAVGVRVGALGWRRWEEGGTGREALDFGAVGPEKALEGLEEGKTPAEGHLTELAPTLRKRLWHARQRQARVLPGYEPKKTRRQKAVYGPQWDLGSGKITPKRIIGAVDEIGIWTVD